MKNYILLIAFFIILFINAYLLFTNASLQSDYAIANKKIGELENKLNNISHPEEEEIELAIYMQRMLTYTNKLWFSGQSGNKDLAHFYVHELEESMEEIYDAQTTYDGVEISPLMKQFGIKAVETFEENMDAGKDFAESYQLLITQCNNCHNSSKHSYIEIITPKSPAFDNQAYRLKD